MTAMPPREYQNIALHFVGILKDLKSSMPSGGPSLTLFRQSRCRLLRSDLALRIQYDLLCLSSIIRCPSIQASSWSTQKLAPYPRNFARECPYIYALFADREMIWTSYLHLNTYTDNSRVSTIELCGRDAIALNEALSRTLKLTHWWLQTFGYLIIFGRSSNELMINEVSNTLERTISSRIIPRVAKVLIVANTRKQSPNFWFSWVTSIAAYFPLSAWEHRIATTTLLIFGHNHKTSIWSENPMIFNV